MLKNVNQERDIGVQLAADFKPSRQCQLAYSRANELLGMIRRVVLYSSLDIMLHLYKLLVRPHLEICISAWFPYYNKDAAHIWSIVHLTKRDAPLINLSIVQHMTYCTIFGQSCSALAIGLGLRLGLGLGLGLGLWLGLVLELGLGVGLHNWPNAQCFWSNTQRVWSNAQIDQMCLTKTSSCCNMFNNDSQ